MSDQIWDKPVPLVTEDSRPYWDGLQRGRLVLQRCAACGKTRHYPRPMCDQCHSMNSEWFTARGTGTVHSWTIAWQAFHPGFKSEIPYTLVIVDLPEGVRVLARLQEPSSDGTPVPLRLGQAVHIGFKPAASGFSLPVVLTDD